MQIKVDKLIKIVFVTKINRKFLRYNFLDKSLSSAKTEKSAGKTKQIILIINPPSHLKNKNNTSYYTTKIIELQDIFQSNYTFQRK